ncbi:hypothetical protein FQN54_009818 [Arachnomyces sp. PD_36]|nr:hypothetical protein FQN54_009818 [Arachnomyces sp. PD_36]
MEAPLSPSSGGSSHPRGSSSAPSTGAYVDNRDYYRIGGPTPLPAWPVKLGPPSQDHPQSLWDALSEVVGKHFSDYGVEQRLVLYCQRWTDGESPLSTDDTLYITTASAPDRSQWFSFMEKIVGIAMELGFKGRVEMIYEKAKGGVRSYPPVLSGYHQQHWNEIERVVAKQLSDAHIPWNIIMPANRGYWEDISRLTIVVKMRQFVPKNVLTATEHSILGEISHHGVAVEISRSVRLWGVFSSSGPVQSSSSLGWPFTHSYNTMGLSLSRVSAPICGTLGGYLVITDKGGKKRTLGVTCDHVVRAGPNDEVDLGMYCIIPENGAAASEALDIQSSGTITAGYPCQSPAMGDISIAMAQAKTIADTPSHLDAHPVLQQQAKALQDQGLQQLREITTFNAGIGTAVGLSGWRNMKLPNDPSTMILLDWAVIEIDNAKDSFNDIIALPSDLRHDLRQLWEADKLEVPCISPLPPAGTVLFKRGRSTGVTAGVLGTLQSAACRPGSVPCPPSLHHRAYIVFDKFGNNFGEEGDSGAWCLNAKGEVVGLLIGGCTADGYALIIPMDMVVQDIEHRANCGAGSVRLKMA